MTNLKNLSEEARTSILNTSTVSVGCMITPEDMGCEGNKKIKIGLPMTPVQLSEIGQQVRSEAHLVGSVINFACENALREAIAAIKREVPKIFRHETKKMCNECQSAIRSWRFNMKDVLGERFGVVEDLVIDRLTELQRDLDVLAFQIEQRLRAQWSEKNLALLTQVLVAEFMIRLSHTTLNCVVQQWWKSHGVDFSEPLVHMDLYLQCAHRWDKVSSNFYDAEMYNAVWSDSNVVRAAEIFSHKLADYDAIFPHIKNVVGEYDGMFSKKEINDISKDVDEIIKNQEAGRKAEMQKNKAYWKKVGKSKASDISQDDLECLKRHFSA